MNKKNLRSLLITVLCCVLLLTACTAEVPHIEVSAPQKTDAGAEATQDAYAQGAAAQETAVPVESAQLANILAFSGSVAVNSEGQYLNAYAGMRLLPGDTVATGAQSEAQIELDQDRLIILEQNSQLSLQQEGEDSFCVLLSSGSVINDIAPGGGAYTVQAGNITMGVLGTIFRVSVDGAEIVIDLFEGKLTVTPTGGTQTDGAGTIQGGERLVVDGSSISTPEPVSFKDLSPERLEWLRNKLMERGADDVLSALDDYLMSLNPPSPSPSGSPIPSPTPLPSPTPVNWPMPFTPPRVPIPTIVEAVMVLGCAPSTYNYASGTWDVSLEIAPSFLDTGLYRAYIYSHASSSWRLASGETAIPSADAETVTVYGVKDNEIIVVASIDAASDSTKVPSAALNLLVSAKHPNLLYSQDRSEDVCIAGENIGSDVTPCYEYRLTLTGSTASSCITEFSYYAVDAPDNIFYIPNPGEDMILRSDVPLSSFDPVSANACLMYGGSLYLYGRKTPDSYS